MCYECSKSHLLFATESELVMSQLAHIINKAKTDGVQLNSIVHALKYVLQSLEKNNEK